MNKSTNVPAPEAQSNEKKSNEGLKRAGMAAAGMALGVTSVEAAEALSNLPEAEEMEEVATEEGANPEAAVQPEAIHVGNTNIPVEAVSEVAPAIAEPMEVTEDIVDPDTVQIDLEEIPTDTEAPGAHIDVADLPIEPLDLPDLIADVPTVDDVNIDID